MVRCLRRLKSGRRVRILETYVVFGKYDAALVVDCPDSSQATEFALRVALEAHCVAGTVMATRIRGVGPALSRASCRFSRDFQLGCVFY